MDQAERDGKQARPAKKAALSRQRVTVSVIMACHNSSQYLEEAVNSVLAQTRTDLELILIDDCSTDDTLTLANRYRAHDPRVSVLSLAENSGPAAARNAGIRAAEGKWLAILDSDDVAEPSRLENQINLAESSENLVMIGSNSISIDDNGHLINRHRYPTTHAGLSRRLSRMRALPPHSSLLYRKDTVLRLSGFNPRFVQSEDYDLWLRLSEFGRLASIDEPLVRIRKHQRNISNSEDGVVQMRMGIVATACHSLRVQGYTDPSTGNCEATWQEFVSWVDRRIREEGIFQQRQAWIDARAGFFAAKNRLIGSLRFGQCLLQSGHARPLLLEKLSGSGLPERLATEWIERSYTAPISVN